MFLRTAKLLILFCLCIIVGAGCSLNRNSSHAHKKLQASPNVSCLELDEVYFEGEYRSGFVKVKYENGLEKQAKSLARITYQAFVHIYNVTGVDIESIGPEYTFYLFGTHLNDCNLCSKNYANVFMARQNDTSIETIVSDKSYFPFVFFHETIEASLFHGSVLNIKDAFVASNEENRHNKLENINTTRWFREGFSDYCSWLAHESIVSNREFNPQKTYRGSLLNGAPEKPFSSLAKIKSNLFTWHQESNLPLCHPSRTPYEYETTEDYYEASVGLFFLIREIYGDDIIKTVINEIRLSEFADSPTIMRTFERIIGVDLRELVENFNFPDTGLYLDSVWVDNTKPLPYLKVNFVKQGSLAEKAGIQKGDFIFKIDNNLIQTFIDFELTLYKLISDGSVAVYLRRDGVGEIATELKLSNQDTEN